MKVTARQLREIIKEEANRFLFENEDRKEGEVDLDEGQSKMVYIMLWAAVEALDANWTPAL